MSTLFGKSHERKQQKKRKQFRAQQEHDHDDAINDVGNECVLVEESAATTLVASSSTTTKSTLSPWCKFNELGLAEPLVKTCHALGFKHPTPVQRTIIPYLLQNHNSNILALAATGSGKTAAFTLPIIHHLIVDPYSIYAVIVTPTRELAKQIHQQVLALGSAYNITSTLIKYPCSIPLKKWQYMIQNKFWSTFSNFSNDESRPKIVN